MAKAKASPHKSYLYALFGILARWDFAVTLVGVVVAKRAWITKILAVTTIRARGSSSQRFIDAPSSGSEVIDTYFGLRSIVTVGSSSTDSGSDSSLLDACSCTRVARNMIRMMAWRAVHQAQIV